MNKTILISAAVFGITAIIFGAFGAHALKELISTEAVQTFETGVRYQMYHALFLLFVGSTTYISDKTKKLVFYFVMIGMLLFSGSIYGLSTNLLTNFDFKSIGFLTPIGGLCLIISWSIVFVNFIKMKGNN
ncbi:MAG: DUF423 domain-containing protein [Flavobacteriales bacterium]|nr:DUF423 domain-containing protein [Flavobacteriia bacterium]NCP06871.1 DUF423 domain-containing protein [Flavobacteriales bacterium]PIV93636.1 MAG: DUF423 domain-containing protein [Flavobacteriaceae bacterium CG17_big_fil_post_rev_8_21_14_2_50_33_15]PIY09823.1 MAG: DUF423 domain-containing protein [Flavobacteriaceae bacterium CG_4_10_14_3_um_filter_33_47]PJB16649.1 MAG: DUF423 domain-containing protein [Flavobacteriaceae bacterium CG_4_9_14_3_um_filter_33_16]